MTGSVSVADQRTLFRLLRYSVENETFPTKQKNIGLQIIYNRPAKQDIEQ